MIFGIGTDLCSVERVVQSLGRTSGLAERLFHPGERELKPESLAARFAAKEALAKAIGDPRKLSWNEICVVKDESGQPHFEFSGDTAQRLAALGDLKFHLSLSHDAQLAQAMVVVESK